MSSSNSVPAADDGGEHEASDEGVEDCSDNSEGASSSPMEKKIEDTKDKPEGTSKDQLSPSSSGQANAQVGSRPQPQMVESSESGESRREAGAQGGVTQQLQVTGSRSESGESLREAGAQGGVTPQLQVTGSRSESGESRREAGAQGSESGADVDLMKSRSQQQNAPSPRRSFLGSICKKFSCITVGDSDERLSVQTKPLANPYDTHEPSERSESSSRGFRSRLTEPVRGIVRAATQSAARGASGQLANLLSFPLADQSEEIGPLPEDIPKRETEYEGMKLDGFITYFNQSTIFVHPQGDIPLLDFIQHCLSRCIALPNPKARVKLVKYKEIPYRCRVIDKKNGRHTVQLIDYGDTMETLSLNPAIPVEVMSIPPMVVRVDLKKPVASIKQGDLVHVLLKSKSKNGWLGELLDNP